MSNSIETITEQSKKELLKHTTEKNNGNKQTSLTESLIEREEVENTPFHIITNKETESKQNSFIAIGKHRVSDIITKQAAKKQIEERNWNLLTNTIITLIDTLNKIK